MSVYFMGLPFHLSLVLCPTACYHASMALDNPPDHGRFRFNERKAAAAAAFLLQEEAGTMDYMRLVKLLYLAERESLARLGHPIVGDAYYALDQGPILSRVLDLCKHESSGAWATQIERSGLWRCASRRRPISARYRRPR